MAIKYKIIIVFLVLAFLGSSGAAVWFWMQIQEFEPDVYYNVPPEKSFIYGSADTAGYGFEDYVLDKITSERKKLIEQKRSFIDVDLQEMKLALYKEGEVFEIFVVQSKGKEGSWWQTPPGAYFVGDKVVSHFSTVARVWMPYAIQFYGNFFIHGWPYDNFGRSLSLGPSGGCIRLLTKDAAVVFEFAEKGMPVLIFEETKIPPLPALLPIDKEMALPKITGRYFMVADLATGELLLNKGIHTEIHADAMVRGMFALAVSEVVSMERRMVARDWMIDGIGEGIIVPNSSYRVQDLLNLLILRSSEESAMVLSRFFSSEYFVSAMNARARSIGMHKTIFVDVTGFSKANTTTLFDTARMMRYIKDYRGFIFNISDKWSGSGSQGKETVFKVFTGKTQKEGDLERHVFIGIADSLDAESDLKNIILWLGNDLGLE